MLEWLAVAEPRLERIVTGNAAVNQHMIAINEQLGYELLEPPGQSYEIAVADLAPAARSALTSSARRSARSAR